MKSIKNKRIPKVAQPPPPAQQSHLKAWVANRKEVFWFCGKLLCLMLVYFAISFTPLFNDCMSSYLKTLARGASWLLNGFGEENRLAGAMIWSQKYSITVLPDCAATEFLWFFCSALIAFPATWRQRIIGAAAGIFIILTLNLLRITSLFYAGAHFHGSFDIIHEELWPAAFIMVTISVGCIWLRWVKGICKEDHEKV